MLIKRTKNIENIIGYSTNETKSEILVFDRCFHFVETDAKTKYYCFLGNVQVHIADSHSRLYRSFYIITLPRIITVTYNSHS